MKRGVIQDSSSPIYSNGTESILHALRDCQQVRLVWTQLGVAGNNRVFFFKFFIVISMNGSLLIPKWVGASSLTIDLGKLCSCLLFGFCGCRETIGCFEIVTTLQTLRLRLSVQPLSLFSMLMMCMSGGRKQLDLLGGKDLLRGGWNLIWMAHP